MVVFVQRFYAQTDEYDIKDVELNSNSYTYPAKMELRWGATWSWSNILLDIFANTVSSFTCELFYIGTCSSFNHAENVVLIRLLWM